MPSRIRLRSAGINSFCLSSSDCKVFASLTHSPSLLHLLFTMSTLDRDATSEQAALTSVGRPEKLEKGCPTYTACFRNCSGVHLTPKTQSAHSSVVAKLSKTKTVPLQTWASLWHSKNKLPSHIGSEDLCTSARCLKEGVRSTVNLKRRLSPPFFMVFLKSLLAHGMKNLCSPHCMFTHLARAAFSLQKEALEGILDKTSTWENSGTRCIVITLVGCLAAAIA